MTLKRDNDTEVQCNESLEPEASVDQSDGFPTPKLSHAGSEVPNAVDFSLQQQGFSGSTVHESFEVDTCQTPIKRIRNVVDASPGSDEASHALGTKRVKEKTDVPRALPSYTDPDVMDGPASEDIDGIPLGDEDAPPRRSTTIALSSRMLTRRATDVPFSAISEADLYAPSPRSAAFIMANVFGESRSSSDALFVWRRKREELKCPLCLDVLVRPVDVAGCGHYVCRTHVIDMYQHGSSRRGIKCCVCRKEETVEDFDRIEVDKNLWLKIQRAKFHSARRKSASPSRSLTPLRERFNRKFLQDVDF